LQNVLREHPVSEKHHLGKYRLLAELGHGGMADVFLAMIEGPIGLGFAKLAVVKRLRANLAEDPEFVTMLIDEARITARLNHPNVVQMLEVGEEGEEYFLAMEYLDGQPLHRLERRAVRGGAPLSRAIQISVLVDVLSGLHHAHELVDYDGTRLDIIHRDVTPHNIFVTYDGQVKVMDFGIAKAAGRAQETKHGIVKGKTRFMSPEQAMGIGVDRRADLFAVGLLLWQAATGKRFWGELDDLAIIEALVAGRYEASPRQAQPDVPLELDRICRRALARNVDDRYSTALEMQQDLEAFLGSETLSAKRELVAIINEHFTKERKQLRAIVEAASKESLSTPSLARLTPRSMMSSNSSASNSFPGLARSVPPGSSGVTPRTDIQIVTIVPPPPAVPASSIPPAVARASPTPRSMFASALAASFAALLAVTLVATFKQEHAGVRAPAAVVATDFIRLSEVTRSRAQTAPPEEALPPQQNRPNHFFVPPAVSPTPSVAWTPPPPPPVASTPTASSNHRAPAMRRFNLDTQDPWTAPDK
jgi:eukaryotic-like serine/threonine-protein kinase